MPAEEHAAQQNRSESPVLGAHAVEVLAAAPSVLVAIASYGTAQDHYLARVMAEYGKLRMRTRVVVMSNKEKLVPGAEVVAGLPSLNPYSLPFAHKKLFGESADRYDLFIYSEDDTLITSKHVEAFLEAQSRLREDEIPGFIRSETSPEGQLFITSLHHHFRWLPESVVERGGELFAALSNLHSGCFMVTGERLRRAIASGGFLVPPHAERYGMLETAASDLYTQCGLRRLICLSRIQDFIVPHLPNKYYLQMGIPIEDLETQVAALGGVHQGEHWTGALYEPGSRAPGFQWSKDLYAPPDLELLGALPRSAKRVLSVGCGRGDLEVWLSDQGISVCAVPLDAVFAALVRKRGIRTVEGPFEKAVKSLDGERFDAVLVADVLHLLDNPAAWLQRLGGLLEPEGRLIASVANTCEPTLWLRNWREGRPRPLRPDRASIGVQPVTVRQVRAWCHSAGLEAERIVPVVEESWRPIRDLWKSTFASRFVVSARGHPGN